ncbi:MAG: Rieske 2Fe-2S domain-containing protein [Pirellulales bacterium]
MWTRIASIHDCPPGTASEHVAGDRIIALYNVAGTFYALDGVCPHQGGPLGKGVLTGCIVTCPWHGWQFDVSTGQHRLNAQYFHPRFEVRVDGDDVLVNVAG